MPAAVIDMIWPTTWADVATDEIHEVVHAVSALGGAVGWLTPPSREETIDWLRPVVSAVERGDAALCTAVVDGQVAALGMWLRNSKPIFTQQAEIAKIMAHPRGRGLGLGRTITAALIEHARRAGLEQLVLGARGNNHLALALYADLGFVEWGRLPNAIAVGDERFDDVRMYLDLQRPPGVVLRGSKRAGPGSS